MVIKLEHCFLYVDGKMFEKSDEGQELHEKLIQTSITQKKSWHYESRKKGKIISRLS